MKISEKILGTVTEGQGELWQKMKAHPLKVKIKDKPKEVIFELVSVMLDNKYRLGFKLSNDEYSINTFGQAYSNHGIKSHDQKDLEWLADEGKWQEIVDIINSGYCKVFDFKQR